MKTPLPLPKEQDDETILPHEEPWSTAEGHVVVCGDIAAQTSKMSHFLREIFLQIKVSEIPFDALFAELDRHKADLLILGSLFSQRPSSDFLRRLRKTHTPLRLMLLASPSANSSLYDNEPSWEGHTQRIHLPISRGRFARQILLGLRDRGNTASMAGELHTDELTDILQLLSHKRQTCLIEIDTGLEQGWLWLLDGELRGAIRLAYLPRFSSEPFADIDC